MEPPGWIFRVLLFASLSMVARAVIDMYSVTTSEMMSLNTDDKATATWMQAAQAGTAFKVITPDPGEGGICFIKCRAFLNRNINLTINVHSTTNGDDIQSYAMMDTNDPGDTSGDIWKDPTWNYINNNFRNYTFNQFSRIKDIPLWTGEAYYMEGSGDLSGTYIHQYYEEEKTLMEVVTGCVNPHVGRNPGPVLGGFAMDSSPAVPQLWGSRFYIPVQPDTIFQDSKGATVKYVTYYPNQLMKATFYDKSSKMHNYKSSKVFKDDGIGAGKIELDTNDPLVIECKKGIAHIVYMTWDSSTIHSSMVQVPDYRAGSDWYQFDPSHLNDVSGGMDLFLEVICQQDDYKSTLWVEEIADYSFGGEVHFEGLLYEKTFDGYVFGINTLSTGVQTYIYTYPVIHKFLVFVFARCTDNSCLGLATMETSPTSEIDFSIYDPENVPTGDANDLQGTGAPDLTSVVTSPITMETGGPSATPEVTGPTVATPATASSAPVSSASPSSATPSDATPSIGTAPSVSAATGTVPTAPASSAAATGTVETKPVETSPVSPGVTSPDVTSPTVEVSTVTALPPYPADNPFLPLCPCMFVEDMSYHTEFKATYLRVLHNEILTMAEWEKMFSNWNLPSQMHSKFGYDMDGFMTFNGKPVWKHAACDFYFFWHATEVQYWLLGPTIGLSRGVMLNYDQVMYPESSELFSPWRLESSKTWVDDVESKTECTCKDVENEIMFFDTPTADYDYEGYYYLYGTLNNHNVYRHLNNSYFLYYSEDCEHWAIGPDAGASRGYAYIPDAVYDPARIGEDGIAVWRLFGGDWNVDDPWIADTSASIISLDSFNRPGPGPIDP